MTATVTQSESRARCSGQGAAIGAGVPVAVTFHLPIPPSVNELFRNVPGKGRVKTQVYNDWRAHALTSIRMQQLTPIDGHVLIRLNVEMAGNRADLDNRVKAIFDAIVEAKIIRDDSLVTGFLVAKLPAVNGLAHIEILPAQAVTVDFRPSHEGARGGWFLTAPQPNGEDDGPVAI